MSVLTGSVLWSISASAPSGYLVCDGSEINLGTYPKLHKHLTDAGNPFGTSNGNPKIPDLITDNRFIRAAGGSLNVGSTQSHALESHSHEFSDTLQPGGSGVSNQSGGVNGTHFVGYKELTSGTNTANQNETYPINIGLLPCIAT
jgi:hypothetical protein